MKRFLRSFVYALRGLKLLLGSGGNITFHIYAAIAVISAAFYFHITNREWCFLIFATGSVFTAEGFNTAIEKLVDFISPQQHEKAGMIKDIAAAAVLITAMMAALIGVLIFLPKLIN